MLKKKIGVAGVAVACSLSLALAGCGSGGGSGSSSDNGGGTDLGDKNITIPYVSWAGSVTRTYLVAQLLDDVGYNVDAKQVEAGPMWASTAKDPDTAMVSAWLPTTHKEYYKKYKNDVKVIKTPNIKTAPLSLTVPKYMKDVNSIKDLKGNSKVGKATDWTITGIDPGAGIMDSTKKAIKNYDLSKWSLKSSSESAMIAHLKKEYKKKEPVVITGWKPHWIFASYDLKMLKDPDKVYGGKGDHVNTVMNKDFADDHPAAAKVLKRYAKDFSEEDENKLMPAIFEQDKDPAKVAKKYAKDHQEKVDKATKDLGD